MEPISYKHMIAIELKFKKLDENALSPVVMTTQAAGIDFCALKNGIIHPNELEMVRTGIALEIPEGWWGLARVRSGIAVKHKISINSSCVIDSDYRGELIFPLMNHSDRPFKYEAGDRIGQLVLIEQPRVRLQQVMELSETERGQGGFGHTGPR